MISFMLCFFSQFSKVNDYISDKERKPCDLYKFTKDGKHSGHFAGKSLTYIEAQWTFVRHVCLPL